MPRVPDNAKQVSGLGEYGIEPNGTAVFITIKLNEDQELPLILTIPGLAAAIQHLQQIAHEAAQRRMAGNPHGPELEPAVYAASQPVQSVEFRLGADGQSLLLDCTLTDGRRLPVQMSYLVAEGMTNEMPKVLAELLRKQQSAQSKH